MERIDEYEATPLPSPVSGSDDDVSSIQGNQTPAKRNDDSCRHGIEKRLSRDEMGIIKRSGGVPTALFRILPEDLDESDRGTGSSSINPCTKEVESEYECKFDYYKFMEFNRCLALLQNLKRLKKQQMVTTVALVGYEYQDSNKSGAELAEKDLKQRFEQLYGPVDFSSPNMQKALNVMRETISEFSKVGVCDPELFRQLLEEGIYPTELSVCVDELQAKITERFSAAEQKKFSTLRPSLSNGEWFVLPRGDLKELRETYFEIVGDVNNFGSEEEDDGSCSIQPINDDFLDEETPEVERPPGPLTNLIQYDPLFEYSFKAPYRIFNLDDELGKDDCPTMVSARVMEHLSRFPNGVCLDQFWESFYETYFKVPCLAEFNTLNSIIYYHEDEIYVATKKDICSRYDLIFPNYMKGIVSPELIMKRIWHAVLCLLGKSQYIPLDELFPRIQREYGFSFSPLDWGFLSVADFLKFCIDKFAQQKYVTIHRVIVVKDGLTSAMDYVMLKSEDLASSIEALHGVNQSWVGNTRRIPLDYLNEDDRIDAVSNYLRKSDVHYFVLETMMNPHRMFAKLESHVVKVDQFQRSIECDASARGAINGTRPQHHHLVKGLYVLASMKYREDKVDWYRGRIIDKIDNEYLVYAIDWGFQRRVSTVDIRFMPHGRLSKELAYAIPVNLLLAHPSTRSNPKWYMSSKFEMYELVGADDLLRAELGKRKYNFVLGCTKWVVTCSVAYVDEDDEEFEVYKSLTIAFYIRYRNYLDGCRKRRAERAAKKASQQVPKQELINDTDTTGSVLKTQDEKELPLELLNI